jgi:hypothetical protein
METDNEISKVLTAMQLIINAHALLLGIDAGTYQDNVRRSLKAQFEAIQLLSAYIQRTEAQHGT